MATSVKVSKRNQITIPAEVRKKLNIKPGDQLLVYVQDGRIVMIPEPENIVTHLRGLHSDVWEGVDAQKYINREREAWRR